VAEGLIVLFPQSGLWAQGQRSHFTERTCALDSARVSTRGAANPAGRNTSEGLHTHREKERDL